MEPSVVLAVLTVAVFTIYWLLTHNYKFWKECDVVYEEPLPIFGNIKDFILRRQTIGEIYRELYRKYPDARFIGAYRMRSPDLIVRDPEDIKRVIVSDFHHFQNRNKSIGDGKRNPFTDNLFNVTSEKWKPMRQKVTPAFTSGKLRNMIPLMTEVASEFTVYLTKIEKLEDGTEFSEVMAKFTTDIIGSCGFGIKMNSMLDENAPFRKMGRRLFAIEFHKVIKNYVRTFSPRLFNMLKLNLQADEVVEFFSDLPMRVIEERIKSGEKRNDFIDLLIELKDTEIEDDKSGAVIKIDNTFIIAQTFIFFAAGFETSSTLMSFTLHELALHVDIQDKVYEEIEKVLKKYQGKITYEAILEMHYLDMVVSETQRKYPALAIIQRICTSDYHFPDSNLTVKKGTFVSIPLLALHYDAKYFPEPEKFIPERFTPEAKQSRHPMVYMPFGDGPRNCIGLRMGRMQSMLGLITVLKDFIVEPSSKTKAKVVLNPAAFVTASRDGIWLKIKRRHGK